MKLPEKSEYRERKRSFKDIEMEVEAEGREWMRQRLQEKLQAQADREGSVFPPERSQGAAPPEGTDAGADGGRVD